MNRVLEELAHLQNSPEADTVHDLRVAIRRCRSLAAAMEEIDPDSAWPEMRKSARKVFRVMGEVRDCQVTREWIQKLAPENDLLRTSMLASLKAEETHLTESAMRAAMKFDKKEWVRLERRLRQRARIVPVGGLAGECMALERLEEAKELHQRALRTEKPKPWHGLRIGLKRLRYTVEGLLPEHYAAWKGNLKRLQDLLGDIHDLDVLAARLEEARESEAAGAAESFKKWDERIVRERRERTETYRQLTLGTTSLWLGWRHHMPSGKRLDAAVAARITATARAVGAHSHRTTQESRLAMRLFALLRRANVAATLREPQMRRIMETAAKLHGITSIGGHRLSQKSIRKFLLGLTIPPNWSVQDWDLMTMAVRFHRGTEPKQKNGFAKLSVDEQNNVRLLAGILRIARGLRKCGMERAVGFRSEKSADAFVLRVPGLPDTAESAARLAAAKHLLETALQKPILLKSVLKEEKADPAEEPTNAFPLTFAASA